MSGTGDVAMPRIRRATASDAPVIARIHIEARLESMPYLPHLHSDEETEDWVRDIVLPGQEVWVATIEGVVAGYIAIDGQSVEALYVMPGFQGRGIGSALLHMAMDRSRGTLELWTFQRNAQARRFYEARGFQAVQLTDGADNEEREPDVRYEWRREERLGSTTAVRSSPGQ